MSPKFIVNSVAMRRMINDLNVECYGEYDVIELCCENDKLYFPDNENFKLDIYAKGQPFKAKSSEKQLRRFQRILGIIEEQPITISIDDNNGNWINFQAVI